MASSVCGGGGAGEGMPVMADTNGGGELIVVMEGKYKRCHLQRITFRSYSLQVTSFTNRGGKKE